MIIYSFFAVVYNIIYTAIYNFILSLKYNFVMYWLGGSHIL